MWGTPRLHPIDPRLNVSLCIPSATSGRGTDACGRIPIASSPGLQVELAARISDRDALVTAALDQVGGDAHLPEEGRAHAHAAVEEDQAGAVACPADPYDP